jgi:NAD(P)-dependent dehydrogenase (short-subunit alcohol dehydrogenase family)
MTMELEGRVAIVTGASRGIGRATAELFAEEGAAVVIGGRDRDALREVAAGIEDGGGRAVAVAADVARADDAAALVSTALDQFGQLDLLVNNAAVSLGKPLIATTEADWNEVLGVNLTGTFLCSMAAFPSLRSRDGSVIVNTSSVLARTALRTSGVYSATKAAVEALTRSMAFEWARYGIRVNCVVPGSTDTDMMWDGIPTQELSDYRVAEEAVIPIGRVASPSEVAQATLWLCSPRASFVTGTALVVDGGSLTEYPGPRYRRAAER